jgi:hypothetical protein
MHKFSSLHFIVQWQGLAQKSNICTDHMQTVYMIHSSFINALIKSKPWHPPPPGIPGEFACLVFEGGGNLNFFLVEGGEICLGGREFEFFF